MNKRLIQAFRAKLGAIKTKTTLPWELSQNGVFFSHCWVNNEQFGRGKCSSCSIQGTEQDLVGISESPDGSILHTHRVQFTPYYDPDKPREADRFSSDGREIYDSTGSKIAGNYDYEAGGIVEPSMAKILVWIINNLPALLDEVEKPAVEACNLPSKVLESRHEQTPADGC